MTVRIGSHILVQCTLILIHLFYKFRSLFGHQKYLRDLCVCGRVGWGARGFSGGASSKEPAFQCRRCKRHRLNPWVRKIPWRRAWQPIPVFLTGEFHGQKSLVGCSLWGCKELDTTEWLDNNKSALPIVYEVK